VTARKRVGFALSEGVGRYVFGGTTSWGKGRGKEGNPRSGREKKIPLLLYTYIKRKGRTRWRFAGGVCGEADSVQEGKKRGCPGFPDRGGREKVWPVFFYKRGGNSFLVVELGFLKKAVGLTVSFVVNAGTPQFLISGREKGAGIAH